MFLDDQEFKNQISSGLNNHMDDKDSRITCLKQFFELRDRIYIKNVDQWFVSYHFEDIARGIYNKYRILPEGWKDDLENIKTIDGICLAAIILHKLGSLLWT